MTFPADYSQYDLVTIDRTKVGTGGVTNHDVWIPKSKLSATAQAGLRSLGQDARFTSADGATQMAGYPVLAKEAVSGVSADFGSNAGNMSCNGIGVGNAPLTWACWIKIQSSGLSYQSHIMFCGEYGFGAGDAFIRFRYSGPQLQVRVFDYANSIDTQLVADLSLTADTWTHVAFTWASDGTMTIYKNASSLGTASETGTISHTDDKFVVGGYFNGSSVSTSVYGEQSQIAEWNSVLSSSEITALANGTPPDQIATTPTRYWDDLSGAGPHAPKIGTGDLTESGTVGDAASDPPVFNNTLAGFRVKLPSISDTVDTQFRVWHNGIDDGLAVDAPYGRNATLSEMRAFWPMNNNPANDTAGAILDETGNGWNGTTQGGMTSDDLVDGVVNQSLDFDGGNDLVVVSNDIIPNTATDVAIELWVKSDAGANCKIFEHNSTAGYFKLGITLSSIDYNVVSSSGDKTISDSPSDTTQWRHVLGVASENGNMTLWVDGVNVDSLSCGSFSGISTYGTAIGADRRGTQQYTDGRIESARVTLANLGQAYATTRYNNEDDPAAFFSSSTAMTATSGVRRAGLRAWAARMIRGGV